MEEMQEIVGNNPCPARGIPFILNISPLAGDIRNATALIGPKRPSTFLAFQ
jgi:hypothetical protein